MAYDLEEQESIDQMKAWWDRWGTPVTSVVCVCCLAFAGWNGWNWWQRNQAAKASQIYAALQNAVATVPLPRVGQIRGTESGDRHVQREAPRAMRRLRL